MSAIVNLKTASDADFVRGFVVRQRFQAWDAAKLWLTGNIVDYLGQVWTALANSTNVAPDSDPLKWQLTARPAIDLTGSTLAFMVRRAAASAEALVALSSADASPALAVTSAVNGAFTLRIPVASLARMPPGVYEQSLIRTRPDGIKEAVWRGTLTHVIGPTR